MNFFIFLFNFYNLNQIITFKYLDTENVLYVWRAIDTCNESGYPNYPGWVREYLGRTAKELLSIEKAGKKAPQLVKNSIGLYGGHFSEIHHALGVGKKQAEHAADLCREECHPGAIRL